MPLKLACASPRRRTSYSCPHFAIRICCDVFPLCDPKLSTFCTTSIPFVTDPNTTCFPSSQSVFTVHRKNCDPFVPGPAFAIDRIPGPVCFSWKFSSSNLFP
eukprot:TRINITY_DN405_c0_g3_i1.p3 TRINITY_DN405_c0_g3~~TRINITY_DN405_c0_g3_i1.p3  ORF type:complete len:102 (+),score=19.41 TRINITY_DN405_c0_g3_i1:15-320(+)